MATYSPFNRIRSVSLTRNAGNGDASAASITKNSLVSVYCTSSSSVFPNNPTRGFYFSLSGVKNFITFYDGDTATASGTSLISGACYVPAGSDLRVDLSPTSGSANFTIQIIEID